jgi:predicted permease
MQMRKVPWRFLLPVVIFTMSITTWVQYYLSVRASDDSPAPWYWYGGLLSACLNFPAYVYSAPTQPLHRFGIKLGSLWIEPRVITFFVIVFAFWYWVGSRIESWATSETMHSVRKKPSRATQVPYALGAVLWVLVTIGTSYDIASTVQVSSWHGLRYLYGDRGLMIATQLLWSVLLALYYFRQFARGLGVRTKA